MPSFDTSRDFRALPTGVPAVKTERKTGTRLCSNQLQTLFI